MFNSKTLCAGLTRACQTPTFVYRHIRLHQLTLVIGLVLVSLITSPSPSASPSAVPNASVSPSPGRSTQDAGTRQPNGTAAATSSSSAGTVAPNLSSLSKTKKFAGRYSQI